MQRIEIRGKPDLTARSDNQYKNLSMVSAGTEYLAKAWNIMFLACVLRSQKSFVTNFLSKSRYVSSSENTQKDLSWLRISTIPNLKFIRH